MEQLARDRILSARGLDIAVGKLREAHEEMASEDADVQRKAMNRYDRLESEFLAAGGYAAEAEAAAICSNLALPDRLLNQPLKTLSGGQRRRVELARILYSGADTMLLDEPTNHLDADSIAWLREFLKNHQGGLIVISHDTELLEATVNKVFLLDANRAQIDFYNMDWKRYLHAARNRRARPQARARQRGEEGPGPHRPGQQDARQGHQGRRRAEHGQACRTAARRPGGGPRDTTAWQPCASRIPSPCGKTPLTADGLSKSYGSLEIFTDVDLAIDRGSKVVILGLNGAGKTTLLRMLAGVDKPDTGESSPGHGLKVGYYAQEHETLDVDRTVLQNMRSSAPDMNDAEVRGILGSFLFSGDDVDKPAGVLSGGEKTRLALATIVASSANVLLLDEPTNNLDPASRAEILGALRNYTGAVVLVSHDEGAVEALNPERVVLLPDGVEDLWNEDYLDLITLA